MKDLKFLFLTLISGLIFTGCSKDDSEDFKEPEAEVVEITAKGYEVENFIYKTMNDIYLYNKDVAVLANNYFASTAEKNLYFDQSSTPRSEEHTSELQSRENLVCRLLLEKKK